MVKAERLEEVIGYCLEHGDKKTCKTFGLTAESLGRYKREYRPLMGASLKEAETLRTIRARFSSKELEALSKGSAVRMTPYELPTLDFDGEEVCFAHITDTHMGHECFSEEAWDRALEECEKQGVQFIAFSGDLTEGMSNRPGHIYELTHLGYDRQKEYAVEQVAKWTKPFYAIDGNHDRWFIKNSGAIIVKDVCDALEDAHFLGHDEGTITVGGCDIRLWHGEDGSSYAFSYRIQKVVEAFTGGDKPHVLLAGHVHKFDHCFPRHVHAHSGGALSRQSRWMRSKRLENHMGFSIIRMVAGDGSVKSFTATWYPFYA